jgi:hypothetical protein
MSERIHVNVPEAGPYLSTPGSSGKASGRVERTYEAIVEDVILDSTHPFYSKVDGYNIGTIRVRILEYTQTIEHKLLPWADPIDRTMLEIPLIGELVLLQKVRGNFFYTKRVSFAHRIQEDGWIGSRKNLNARPNNRAKDNIRSAVELDQFNVEFGKYFYPDSRVRQLHPFEGDMIFQGRMGHSIRFGSSKMDPASEGLAPNIILRAGQGKDVEQDAASIDTVFGLVLEDVNKDASSVWLTSDQVVILDAATKSAGSWARSYKGLGDTGQIKGASIVANSDRIVLNSKNTDITLFSREEIHLNSFNNTSIDTDNSILLTANVEIVQKAGEDIRFIADNDFKINTGNDFISITLKNTSILAEKIYIGSFEEDKEPMVGGTSLSVFLGRLILTLMGNPAGLPAHPAGTDPPSLPRAASPGIATTTHVIGGMGPAALNPAIVARLIQLYGELSPNNSGQRKSRRPFAGASFNSRDSFVVLKNETPSIEKNDFKTGEQLEVISSQWKLSDPYYKVL